MGHTLAVMGEGQVAQVGPIEEVFRRPVNAGVAEIMGVRNLFGPGHQPWGRKVDAGLGWLGWRGRRRSRPPAPCSPATSDRRRSRCCILIGR